MLHLKIKKRPYMILCLNFELSIYVKYFDILINFSLFWNYFYNNFYFKFYDIFEQIINSGEISWEWWRIFILT